MAPVTRSKKTPISGFPNPADASRVERPLTSERELRPLKVRNPDPYDPVPPKYTIDLSRPPAERYAQVVADFKPQLAGLTGLFDDVVKMSHLPLKTTTDLARLFLRRLYSKEQTEELRGISKASGVEVYLLVCFNTLLDLFMGCTSGGARVRTVDGTRMYHFRTLDWGMDALRRVIVQLEFVEKPHGPIIARSVTYVGYVGVLTGVREGLSVSLNFRPYHNNDTSTVANLRLQYHLLMVLLGFQPSISAKLRDLVVPPVPRALFGKKKHKSMFPSLGDIKRDFPSMPTTAVYLIFCNGDETTVFEKDRVTANVRSSRSFITITNCDVQPEGSEDRNVKRPRAKVNLLEDLLEEAEDRRVCLEKCWKKAKQRLRHRESGGADDEVNVSPDQLVRWIQSWPTTNECTHYAVVMDPKAGEVVWARRWLDREVEPKVSLDTES